MNNDFSAWSDEWVGICNANCVGKSVRFGELLPIMQEKPDVMEQADCYVYQTAGEFVSAYSSAHYNFGYGQFIPDI